MEDDYYAFVNFIQTEPSLDQLRSAYSPEKVRAVIKHCGKSTQWMHIAMNGVRWGYMYYKWLFDECHVPLNSELYSPYLLRDSNFIFPLDCVVYYSPFSAEFLHFFLSWRAPTRAGLDTLYSRFDSQEANLRLIEAGAKPNDSKDPCYSYYAFRQDYRAAVLAFLRCGRSRVHRRVIARELWPLMGRMIWSRCRQQWLLSQLN
jgi:hypothetical protein